MQGTVKKFKINYFSAQHDVYEGDPAEVDEDQIIDGRFEVVPGVTADEYIKRFTTVEISNPSDQRNFRIRVPPPPEAFYDTGTNKYTNFYLLLLKQA